jgi:hypothetical protein
MDYGKVLSRAWQITWRWKVLWILGFLASLGSGGGGGGNTGYTYGGDGNGSGQWPGSEIPPEQAGMIIAIIIAVAIVAILVGIALWVVSIIARGGLIAGVQQVEDEGTTSFRSAWRVGVSRFWTLFGIDVLTVLPIVVLVLAMVTIGIVSFVSLAAGAESSEPLAIIGGIGPWLVCGIPLCCGMIIAGWVLGLIKIYADRAAVLEGLGWIDAFKRGWQVIKTNIGPTLIFWLIFLVIGFVIAAIVAGGVLALAMPLIALFTTTDVGAWILVPICGGGLIGIILSSLLSSVVGTFTSATWTLAYRELTAKPSAEPAAALSAK